MKLCQTAKLPAELGPGFADRRGAAPRKSSTNRRFCSPFPQAFQFAVLQRGVKHTQRAYHIALLDRPTIVWDFHSLLLGVQMMFSFLLTDDKTTLRCCKHCNKAFIASQPSAVFCSPQCKNKHNVYKSRAKD